MLIIHSMAGILRIEPGFSISAVNFPSESLPSLRCDPSGCALLYPAGRLLTGLHLRAKDGDQAPVSFRQPEPNLEPDFIPFEEPYLELEQCDCDGSEAGAVSNWYRGNIVASPFVARFARGCRTVGHVWQAESIDALQELLVKRSKDPTSILRERARDLVSALAHLITDDATLLSHSGVPLIPAPTQASRQRIIVPSLPPIQGLRQVDARKGIVEDSGRLYFDM